MNAQSPVLYAGDASLHSAAAYLAALLTSWRIGFDYMPTASPLTDDLIVTTRQLYVLSDYPAVNVSEAQQRRIAEHVAAGAGLLMIGGWASFQGLRGGWHGTTIGNLLPVSISTADDRVHCDQPAVIIVGDEHETTAGLPWQRPPCVGGFNRVVAKPTSHVALWSQRFAVEADNRELSFVAGERDPLLVLGQHGQGRTAALMTDCAPHWVGGLIDWGAGRVQAQAKDVGGRPIEVGDGYANLLENIVRWTGHLRRSDGEAERELP